MMSKPWEDYQPPDTGQNAAPTSMPWEDYGGPASAPQPVSQPPSQPSLGSQLEHVAARTGRDLVGGLGSIADIGYVGVAPLYQGERALAKMAGIDVGSPQDVSKYAPSSTLKYGYDKLTNNTGLPQNNIEAIADKAGEAVSSGIGTGLLAKAPLLANSAAQFLKNISPQTIGQAAAFAGAGAGSEIAHQAAPESEIAPLVGTIVGGGAAGLGASLKDVTPFRNADDILAARLSQQNIPALKEALEKGETQSSVTPEGDIKQYDTLTLPDVAGDEIKGLTRLVGKQSGGAKDIVSDFLNTRSNDSARRISNLLSNNVSSVDTYFGNLDDLAQARAAIAAPLYKEAFSANKSMMTPEINRVLDTPAGQSALRSASIKMQNDMSLMGASDPDLVEQAKLAGTYQPGDRGIASGLNLRSLDYVKRALDDQIGTAQRAGENDNARILTGLKSQLVNSLDSADITAKAGPNSLKPEGGAYAQARNVYSSFSSIKNAQEEGLNFMNSQPEEINKMMEDLSPAEKDAYRIGARQKLQQVVNSTPDGADPAKRIFGNTQRRDQLQAMMDNNPQYQQFASKLRDEISAADTKFKVLGGSRTDINLAEDGSPLIDAAQDALRYGKHGLYGNIVNAIGTSIQNKYVGLTKDNSLRLAEILTNRDEGTRALDRMIAGNKTSPMQQRALIEARSTLVPLIENAGTTLENPQQ